MNYSSFKDKQAYQAHAETNFFAAMPTSLMNEYMKEKEEKEKNTTERKWSG